MHRKVVTKSGDTYETGSKLKQFTIVSDTFIFQESVRVIKFKNERGTFIIIPWENIDTIEEY